MPRNTELKGELYMKIGELKMLDKEQDALEHEPNNPFNKKELNDIYETKEHCLYEIEEIEKELYETFI